MEERNPRASALGRGDDAHLSLGAAKVLVAAVTCQRNADRVAACSQTWVPLLERDWGIPTLFVQGDPSQAEEARLDPVTGILTLPEAFAGITSSDVERRLDDLCVRLARGIVRTEVVALRRMLIGDSRAFPRIARRYFDRAPGQVLRALRASESARR